MGGGEEEEEERGPKSPSLSLFPPKGGFAQIALVLEECQLGVITSGSPCRIKSLGPARFLRATK